jgi:hypothetical protein
MSFIDTKYIGLISSRLDKFSQKNSKNYEFRCWYCGDSKKSQSKKRGNLYQIGTSYNYKCFNCGKSVSFSTFLKDLDSSLHDQYILEKYKETGPRLKRVEVTPKIQAPKLKVIKKYFDLPSISQLNKEHFARLYLEDRKIPKHYLDELYFCEKFKHWTNTQKPTFKFTNYDEPRIIIPLVSGGNIFGFQGRSLSKKENIKYITVILDDAPPKIYGVDSINWDNDVYIVEGPFDKMFLSNSIAMAGADIDLTSFSNNANFIYVYDNERRNEHIVRRMEKVIDLGHSIVIWPNDLKEKDINDMILAGKSPSEIIKKNTFKGLQAKVKLTEWKRV